MDTNSLRKYNLISKCPFWGQGGQSSSYHYNGNISAGDKGLHVSYTRMFGISTRFAFLGIIVGINWTEFQQFTIFKVTKST